MSTDNTTPRTTTITVAEGATLLSLSATIGQEDVYHLLRSQLRDEFLTAVTIILGGPHRLAELDKQAGYTPAEDTDDQ